MEKNGKVATERRASQVKAESADNKDLKDSGKEAGAGGVAQKEQSKTSPKKRRKVNHGMQNIQFPHLLPPISHREGRGRDLESWETLANRHCGCRRARMLSCPPPQRSNPFFSPQFVACQSAMGAFLLFSMLSKESDVLTLAVCLQLAYTVGDL